MSKENKIATYGYVTGRKTLGFETLWTYPSSFFFIGDYALYVTSIETQSFAYKNGLRLNDKIVSYKLSDGNEIDILNSQALLKAISNLSINDTLGLKVTDINGQNERHIKVKIEQYIYKPPVV